MEDQGNGIKVRVSEDGLTAQVEPLPSREGGRGGVARLLQEALIRAGVTKGIDTQALKRIFALLGAGQPVPETVVAQGRPAGPGQAGRIEYLVSLDREEIGTKEASGHIDFRNKGELPQVVEGQELARLIPPGPGEPGFTVQGRILKPEPATGARLRAGKNTTLRGDTLIADKPGLLKEDQPGRLSVFEVLELRAVDNESGHVEFKGLVRLAGGVARGYRVRAGALEAANLEIEAEVEVDDSVVINGPVLGATIKAGGEVRANLIRKSEIDCQGDLLVKAELVESTVRAAGVIRLISPQGRIVNSDLSAGLGVETGSLVSKGKTPSRVTLGLREDPGPEEENEAQESPADQGDELAEKQRKLEKALAQVESRLREWGARWRETADPDLARQIKEKGVLFKKLKDRLDQISALLEGAEGADGPEPDAVGAYLSVSKKADTGLTIQGLKSILTLKKPLRSFTARESLQVNPETGQEEWVISIQDARKNA